MEKSIIMKMEKLNKICHLVINNSSVSAELEEFKALVSQIKFDGHMFKVGVHNTDFSHYELNTNEIESSISIELYKECLLTSIVLSCSSVTGWYST
jgi:hypothetical protein